MTLAHVGAALLLPVARPARPIAGQMAVLQECRIADNRFHLAYSVPAKVPNRGILEAIAEMVGNFGVCAVKLHPNLSNIDLGSPQGRARTLAILAACDALQLPLIVHGGRSPILGSDPAAEHAVLSKLETIDWSMSRESVVLAHFGVYGCHGEEIAGESKRLNRLLARHSNVVTDTSGIDYAVLASLLRTVDHDRILFGSDAMYTPMWKSVVQLFRALEVVESDAESAFVRIASVNPCRRLGVLCEGAYPRL